MRRLIIPAAIAALFVVGCGGESTDRAKSKPQAKTWTVAQVQREYNRQLQDKIDADGETYSVDTSCLLRDGEEGGFATLKCHLDYSDGDASTIEIDVDKTGDWIANSV